MEYRRREALKVIRHQYQCRLHINEIMIIESMHVFFFLEIRMRRFTSQRDSSASF
jgi:hypothetical protein